MLKILFFPEDENKLHFTLKRTQCNAVRRNKIKRVIREEFRKSGLVGKLIVGVSFKSSIKTVKLEELSNETRKSFNRWLSRYCPQKRQVSR